MKFYPDPTPTPSPKTDEDEALELRRKMRALRNITDALTHEKTWNEIEKESK